MIVSRYLSEPDTQHPPLLSGSEPGRLFGPPFRTTRQPFDRLKFWTVHPLVHRLNFYQASEPGVSVFRRCSWSTLVYWQELTDVPAWPSPDAPPARRFEMSS